MSVRDHRREATIDALADHLLREGLGAASLRSLATAVGTSDRMLLYYFSDKDELLTATLGRAALRLAALLDVALPGQAVRTPAVLLAELWEAMKSPALRPFMHLWLELAAGAARGAQPHRGIAGQIADGFAAWIVRRLPGPDSEAEQAAATVLAALEGLLVIDAVGRRGLADLAASRMARAI